VNDRLLSSVSLSIRSIEQDIMGAVERLNVPIESQWSSREKLSYTAKYLSCILHKTAKVKDTDWIQHITFLIRSRFEKRSPQKSTLEDMNNIEVECSSEVQENGFENKIIKSSKMAADLFLQVSNIGARGLLFVNYMEAIVCWALGHDHPNLSEDVPAFLLQVMTAMTLHITQSKIEHNII
jgi:hypothetical protein